MIKNTKAVIISYRIPVTLEQNHEGTKTVVLDNIIENSIVRSAVESLLTDGKEVHWFGVCGGSTYEPISFEEKEIISNQLEQYHMNSVFLDSEVTKVNFRAFCKNFLWPLFHYCGNSTNFSKIEWEAYQKVNETFAKCIVEYFNADQGIIYETDSDESLSPLSKSPAMNERNASTSSFSPKDRRSSLSYPNVSDLVFLIQDYHLMLLPFYLRQRLPNAKIGFFLHIPWPSSEIYRSLPIRELLVGGLLSADLIAFQAFNFARHFLSCCTRLLGLRVNDKGVPISDGRFARIEVMPIGINSDRWIEILEFSQTKDKIKEILSNLEGKTIIVSRDRTDFVKGIPNKLKIFRAFLKKYPEWQGKIVLFQECEPNPEVLNERGYRELCEQIAQLVGSINGEFGSIQYTPIHYLNQVLSIEESASLLSIADLGLCLPLRDGMNMFSHDFIACQQEKMSPLILSEFAGAAHCLSGSILVNPWHEKQVVKKIFQSLSMSPDERKARHLNNFGYVKSHTVSFWINNLIKEVASSEGNKQFLDDVPLFSFIDVKKAYMKATKRLIFLDYDGTLTPIVKMPHLAIPSRETFNLLAALATDPNNYLYIISGRDRKFLEEWFSSIPIGLSGEHGSFFRLCPKPEDRLETNRSWEWHMLKGDLDLGWKDIILPILQDYTVRTPGSFIEQKEINVTWHYRNADVDFGDYQVNALVLFLQGLPKMPIDILRGDKAIEIRPAGVNKGAIVKRLMSEYESDFVLCIGDDTTDEDMFNELKKLEQPNIFTATVKQKPTAASGYIEDQRGVLDLLHFLVGSKAGESLKKKYFFSNETK